MELQAERLRRRLEERGIALEITEAARELLARAGFDPAYGARPLKRVVQRRIENPLAQKVLAGEIRDGDRVVVGADGEELTFTVADRGTPAAPPEPEAVSGRGLGVAPAAL